MSTAFQRTYRRNLIGDASVRVLTKLRTPSDVTTLITQLRDPKVVAQVEPSRKCLLIVLNIGQHVVQSKYITFNRNLNIATYLTKTKIRPLLAKNDDRPSSTLTRANSDAPRPKSKTHSRAKSDTHQDSLLRAQYFGSTVSLFDTEDTFTRV